jgi:hypothetical protein
MEKLNDIFDVEVAKTIDAYPSVFSKDDVIQLITRLRTDAVAEALEASRQLAEDERKFFISEMDFQEFSSNVCKALEREINNGGLDVYDYSSAEFSIGYNNQLSIESIEFNTDAIVDELSDILLDRFQESFGKLLNPEAE